MQDMQKLRGESRTYEFVTGKDDGVVGVVDDH